MSAHTALFSFKKYPFIVVCTALILTACGGGGAGGGGTTWTPPINDTGVTKCYNNTAEITCDSDAAFAGQDASFGRDANAATTLVKVGGGAEGFDYTKVCMSGELAGVGACAASPVAAANQAAPTADEWACTKDNVTNLIWSLESGYGIWDPYAITTLPGISNTAIRCGFSTGWRLPTRRELLSIVHNGTVDPAIDTGYFPGTSRAYYWSNDTYAPNPAAKAWYVVFSDGNANAIKGKIFNNVVRLVHGTPLPDAALTDNGDGTVTDTTTGLMWDQCSQGQSGVGCATGTVTAMTWSAALTRAVTANTANYKGHNDWRLPNRKELESIVDITATNPAIDLTAFPATPASSYYWSSTTYTSNPGAAWFVFFLDGYTFAFSKSNGYSVRLVRSGQ